MLDRHHDFIDVLERAVNGGVLIETDAGGDTLWETSDASVWLDVTIAGVTVIKVEAGLAVHALVEDDQLGSLGYRDD